MLNADSPAVDLHQDVITVTEAAAFLRCGPKVVRRLCKLRRLPHRVLDRRGSLRFSRAALEAWLAERGK